MPYTKETIAEVKDAFDKAYMEHKHEWPTKICGPNLVGILNSAGFYQKKEWVGLTDEEIHNLGWMDEMSEDEVELVREVEAKLKGIVLQAANELRRLHQCLRNVYEVWAGSEGIPAPTVASEAYLLSLVEQMRDAAKEGLNGG
jgi:hypothetical protein